MSIKNHALLPEVCLLDVCRLGRPGHLKDVVVIDPGGRRQGGTSRVQGQCGSFRPCPRHDGVGLAPAPAPAPY